MTYMRGNLTLLGAVRTWPTPRSTDGSHGGRVTPRKSRQGGNLIEAVSAARWPTPRSQNAEPRNHKVWLRPSSEPQNLENAIAAREPAAIGGQLNPTWVEWLMGFPLGWTVLEPSETPSSRKSRKRSAE